MRLIEFDQFIGADGEVYYMTDGLNRFILSFSGLGMPPIEYITQKGPFQHGETVLDYRLQPRVFQLVYREQACSRQAMWDNRNSLLDALKPNRTEILAAGTFRKIMPDGSMRDIDVFISQGPAFSARNTDQWDEYSFTETIRFIAHDPLLYNPEELTSTFSPTAITELTFPITFPITFGSSFIDDTNAITYSGTWPSFPTITIVGPVTGLVIENTTTDEKIEFDYDIPDGVTVTITLGYGNKTVTDSDGNNLIGAITDDSNLDSFHISSEDANSITVQGADTDAGTQITIAYYDRYIGI